MFTLKAGSSKKTIQRSLLRVWAPQLGLSLRVVASALGRAMLVYLPFLSALFCFAFPKQVGATVWPDIRDGVIHIEIPADPLLPISISVNWQDAWISKSQTDHIFLQKPNGSLQEKIILNDHNTPGKKQLNLVTAGIYRLEITGASFRNVTVTIPEGVHSMFEPVKVHKSISLPAREKLYFHVPKAKEFTFGCKTYGQISRFTLSPNKGDDVFAVNCRKHKNHSEFDQKEFPPSKKETIWELRWRGKGKVSFWVDSIPNLFAQAPEDLFELQYAAAESHVQVTNTILGRIPAIGAALPFTAPPQNAYALIKGWKLSAANHYIFTDYFEDQQSRNNDFLSLYEEQFSIPDNNAIFGISGRKTVFDSTERAQQAVLGYLKQHKNLPGHRTYYSIGDEPNLNYPSYKSYAKLFGSIATAIKNNPDETIRKTRLAVPQSSRFQYGPTRSGAEDRVGIDWAEKLIKEYGEYIDAISWHEWLVRDLLDTPRYRESVERANTLIHKYQDRFKNKPALIIGQTNISSGSSLSPYENDTFFAALWWTSVVIQSSLPGTLNQLIWFKAADDGIYNKGLVTVHGNSFIEKPVGRAMTFINSNIGSWVMKITGNHPELDVLATLSADKTELRLLGVNKMARKHVLQLSLPHRYQMMTLRLFSVDKQSETTSKIDATSLQLPLEGETIFAATFHLH